MPHESSRLCDCGCGATTPIATRSRLNLGHVKGEHLPYLTGHNSRTRPVAERLWKNVDKRGPDECWEWQGYCAKSGYGTISNDGPKLTHRVAYEVANGPIPDGMFVCHTCDNRKCVNPAHLFLGTHADNMADMVAKGRSPRREVWLQPNSYKLTGEQVQEIRDRFLAGDNRRQIARDFKISREHVYRVGSGKSWPEGGVS